MNGMEKELRKQIDCHDAVSFDIFDTLIMRKVLNPHDIFMIVEQKAKKEQIPVPSFYKNRIQAERNLIAKIPNIYELYDELQRITNLSDIDCRQLLELELETEHSSLIRRDSICKILDDAYENGKYICLVSDMYIPKEILLEWLKELEITKFHKALISCEYHKPKVDGLYEIYKKESRGIRFLHIGDHEIYDGTYAKAAGINSFLIPSAVSSMEHFCPFEVKSYMEKKEDKAVLGLLAAKLYNSPFSAEEIEVKNLQEIVYDAAAPMISGLALWLIEQLSSGIYDGLLLAARDGYLIQKMLKIYEAVEGKPLPCHDYFYTSRSACAAAVIENLDDFIQAVRRPLELSMRECVKERLEMTADGAEDAREFYAQQEKKILVQSKKMKARYLHYISGWNLRPEGNYAFFDFVSSGTCLSLLNKILGKNLTGLFCYHYDCDTPANRGRHLNIKSFFNKEQGKRFWKYYKIFETILTAPDGTFLRFDKEGKPVFAEDMRSKEELHLAEEMQNQVLEYWKQLLKIGAESAPSADLLVALTELLDGKRVVLSDRKKDILYLYDSFEGGKIKVFS